MVFSSKRKPKEVYARRKRTRLVFALMKLVRDVTSLNFGLTESELAPISPSTHSTGRRTIRDQLIETHLPALRTSNQ